MSSSTCPGASNGSNLDHVGFYFNLHGAQVDLVSPNDTCLGCGGADSVDFFFFVTHGDLNGAYYMWDQSVVARSTNMRLGDNGQQAKVFASYACDTMTIADGNQIGRWENAFNGGLKISLGGYDLVYEGNDQKGTEFSGRIENGQPVGFSWNEAVWYADNSNHPIAFATGATNADCSNRRQANLGSVWTMPRLQDDAWQYLCTSGWN